MKLLRGASYHLFLWASARKYSRFPITRQVELNPGTMSGLIALDFAVPLMTNISKYTLVVHSSPDSVGVAIPLHNIGWAT